MNISSQLRPPAQNATHKKIWILIFTGSIVVGFAIYYSAVSGLSSGCAYKTLSEAVSPDGKYIATVIERNCGATTPYTRGVTIRRNGTFLIADGQNSMVFVVKDQPNIAVSWSAPRQLKVVTEGFSRTAEGERLKATHWRDVEVVVDRP